jgi:hypothetical protein
MARDGGTGRSKWKATQGARQKAGEDFMESLFAVAPFDAT